jgi:hypothetical protein
MRVVNQSEAGADRAVFVDGTGPPCPPCGTCLYRGTGGDVAASCSAQIPATAGSVLSTDEFRAPGAHGRGRRERRCTPTIHTSHARLSRSSTPTSSATSGSRRRYATPGALVGGRSGGNPLRSLTESEASAFGGFAGLSIDRSHPALNREGDDDVEARPEDRPPLSRSTRAARAPGVNPSSTRRRPCHSASASPSVGSLSQG